MVFCKLFGKIIWISGFSCRNFAAASLRSIAYAND